MEQLIEKIRSLSIHSLEQTKLLKLKEILEGKSILCAFSGGIDSSLLLIFSKVWAGKVLAVTIASEFIPKYEINNAMEFTKQFGIDHDILTVDLLENEEISSNPKNRCYICKHQIFDILLKIAKINQMDFVVDGSNYSDLDVHRPGMMALKELGIISPFLQAEITKKEIIAISKELELPSAVLPPMACLASRIPYNRKISKDILEMIEKAEDFLRTEIQGLSTTPLRVRYDELENDLRIARIEVNPDFIPALVSQINREKILKYFENLGFYYVLVDLAGFESGKLDRLLKLKEKK